MRHIKLSIALALLTSASAALADNAAKAHSESTDTAGTTVTTDKSHDESTSLMGTKKTETDVKVSNDPKGLGNKTKANSHTETSVGKNGDVSKTTTSNDAYGTKRETSDKKETDSNWNGGHTTTTTHTEVIDPKGLGNKQKVEVKEEVKQTADGTTKTVTKKVNGDTVTEETKSGM